jgi:hypothetical protein
MMLTLDHIKAALCEHGLGDDAGILARIILDHCLTWNVSPSDVDHVDAIVAFAFGNRIDEYGNRTPGPINALLADAAVAVYEKFDCQVLAQWEIAKLLSGRIPADQLYSINPAFDAQTDSIKYLSSAGVLEQVRNHIDKKSSIYIVAHRDHLYRCSQLAERAGFHAVSDSENMPVDYDPSSSQAWTRRREIYLVSDMISRLAAVRQELIGSIES